MELVLVFAFVFVILCALERGLGRFLYLANKIPGPSLWELCFVHGKHLLGNDMLSYVCYICDSYDHKPWSLWRFSDFTIVLSDPETVGEVLRSKDMLNKSRVFYEALTKYFGYGLFSLNGKHYRRHRKVIEPSFRKGFLEFHILPQANDESAKLVEHLRQKDVNVKSVVEDQAVELSFLTLTSGMYRYPSSRHFWKASHAALSMVQIKSINPFYYWCWYKWRQSTKDRESVVDALHAEMKDILLEVKDVIERTDLSTANPLEFMLRGNSEEKFTDDELFAEFRTLIISVFETTSFTANICLILLALHPEVQQRVYEELVTIFEHSDRPVEPEDLSRMVYMDMVLKETLRLFPPGPLIGRRADKETSLNGLVIPKGCTVVINIMALHRNKHVFKDPLKFYPERFSVGLSEERHPFSHIPFSFGGRACPGQQYAFLVIKTVLSYILRNFKVLPTNNLKSLDDIKVKMAITMHLSKSIPLRLINRKEEISL